MGKVKKNKKKKFSKFKLTVMLLFILIIAGGGTYCVTLLSNKDSGNTESTETSNKVEITYDKDNAEVTEESTDESSNEVANNTESENINNSYSESVVTEEADEEGFTKKKAVKYLRDDRIEYYNYDILEEENGKFYLTNNGTKVIEISLWDIETSPVTGQNYYGYNLKKYGDDSSNEEFGMINQNGTVEVQ